jgi:hypothetical protein
MTSHRIFHSLPWNASFLPRRHGVLIEELVSSTSVPLWFVFLMKNLDPVWVQVMPKDWGWPEKTV